MKNKGFTLIEIMTALVLSSLIILAIAVLFIAEFRFRNSMNNEVYVAREAKTVISHMSRTLRFAKSLPPAGNYTKLDFTIEAGHLGFASTDTPVEYNYNQSGNIVNAVYFKLGANAACPIAYDITSFNVYSDGVKNFTINVTAQKGNTKIDLETFITTIAG